MFGLFGLFGTFEKNKTENVIRLVYPADKTLCPDCGAYRTSKICPKCKKLNKIKKSRGSNG